MKLSFDSVTIEADTVADVAALLALIPSRQSSRPASPAIASDRERDLRDAYREAYGKGFTMKGRDGTPLECLESLAGAGWPKAGGMVMDEIEGAPAANTSDDGEEFV